jgi:pimeloyl-ACP methyl ester carboxylesterase
MQKLIKLKTKDNHLIYGVLDLLDKSDKLIIFVHGLTSNINEHQFFNGVKFFNENGFDTFRISLYYGDEFGEKKLKGRKLEDCTMKIHSQDLTTVKNYFKNKYQKIYLVGHSLGGPVILYSDLSKVASIVLWDPSINISKKDFKIKFNKKLKKYIVEWAVSYILNKEMVLEWEENKNYSNIIKKIKIPTKIICAGLSGLAPDWKKAISNFLSPTELKIIKNATHGFDELASEEELFKETLNWLKKY